MDRPGGSLMNLRKIALLCALMWMATSLPADEHSVDADTDVDFSRYHTYVIRQQVLNTKKPELNSPLTKEHIANAIREQLAKKGLEEGAQQPDLIVNFHFGAADQREVQSWPTGRWGRGRRVEVSKFTEGTLVIDILDRVGRGRQPALVWRGVYTDEEKDADKLAKKLPGDVKKLFEDYPPKKNN